MNEEAFIGDKNLVDDAIISIERLNKSFGSNKVLIDLSISVKKGESLVVLGKSGSGKSVLIKCIIGLMKPESGKISVFGKDIAKLGRNEVDSIRSKMGFLFQSNALYDSMTIRENLEFPMRRHLEGLSLDMQTSRLLETLENVGLKHTVDKMPSELSGGMQKRIALARTLVLQPEVILYDEPTTGLDPITGREISDLIREVQNKYKTSSIIISHDMNCVKRTADRIAVLIDGSCYATGNYDELAASTDKNIQQFFEH